MMGVREADGTALGLPTALVLFCYEDCWTRRACYVREADDEKGNRSALSDRNPLLPSQTLNGVYKSESPGYDRCAERTSRSCCLSLEPNPVIVIFSSHMALSLNMLRWKDHQSH